MKRIALLFIMAVFQVVSGPIQAADSAAIAQRAPDDSSWRLLFSELAAKTPVTSQFTEHRWFSFKKKPVLLKGEMRFSKELGLSLHYTEPEERVVLADGKGLMLRDKKGRVRTIPADPRAPETGQALMGILRFDYDDLSRTFEILGSRNGKEWSIVFVPRDRKLERSLGRIEVSGEKDIVRRLEFKRSANQRIEIMIGETRNGVLFDAQELKQFFR